MDEVVGGLRFTSNFDSGNLARAVALSPLAINNSAPPGILVKML